MRIPGIAGTTGIEDLFTELTGLIADEEGKAHWWVIEYEAMVTFFIQKHHFYLKMPLPRTRGRVSFASDYYRNKHNEEEIERVRVIWIKFIADFKERLEKVEVGEISISEAFKDGIPIDEKYGLEYKGRSVRQQQ